MPLATDEDPWSDTTPMWLSHHWPDEYDRCAVVRGRRVCRRCLMLYPVSLLAAFAMGLGLQWPERLDPWFAWLLPLPAVIEFVAEQLGLAEHSPRRQVAATLLLSIACGRLYLRYLDDHADGLAWGVIGGYGLLCAGAFFLRAFRPTAR